MTPAEHLAVPYVLTMEPVIGADGHWVCRAEYPELTGCRAETFAPTVALRRLEEQRITMILERLDEGAAVPVPRPPLAYLIPEYERLVAERRQSASGHRPDGSVEHEREVGSHAR